MLTAAVFVPLVGALVLVALRGPSVRGTRPASRGVPEPVLRLIAFATSLVPLVLLIVAWLRFDTGVDGFQLVEAVEWIPTLGVGYILGVDGMSLALAATSALVFTAAIAWPTDTRDRPRQYYAWMLFLEVASLGVFLALDLLLFYVFFDLSLVGMYFLIAEWGHGEPRRAAIKFFLYTLAGSLVMLLAIVALYLATDPLTFDMRVIIAEQPLAGAGLTAGLVLAGLVFGLAVKTPLVPVHTWLPPAHVNAPAPASAILAGVLLKLGTYGLVRLPLQMLSETFADFAFALGVLAVVAIVYGALVALGQGDLKRRIAYTSVNHMGYTVLGIAAAGALLSGEEAARELALTGAVVEMVAHALITGSLFLISGVFYQHAGTYDMDRFGGLAAVAPLLTGATVLAAFASLGLPGLAGFVAEIHIFIGAFSVFPWLVAVALLGVLITAALFLQMLQRVFLGDGSAGLMDFADLRPAEAAVLGVLLAFVVAVGVFPRFLLDVVAAASRSILGN